MDEAWPRVTPLECLELFRGLGAPHELETGPAFQARAIPGRDGVYVARSSSGAPCLLIRTTDIHDGAAQELVPRRLKYIDVSHGVECRVSVAGGEPEHGTYTIVECLSHDGGVQEYFVRLLALFVDDLRPGLGLDDIALAIGRLADLFTVLDEPARTSVQGLWAELFAIAESSDPALMLSCWRREGNERFDFSDGMCHLEVKSWRGGIRSHQFSLEQLEHPSASETIVLSVKVEPQTNGVTIADLVESIRDAAGRAVTEGLVLEERVAAALGSRTAEAVQRTFDAAVARTSVCGYWAEDIPRPSGPIPREVSGVRFVVDCSAVREVDYWPGSGLFGALEHLVVHES